MRLTLSSEAAPDLSLAELLEAAARRGFAGVELVSGHAHGVDLRCPTVELLEHVEAAGGPPRIAAFRAATPTEACSVEAALLSRALRVPIIAPPGELDGIALRRAERVYRALRGTLLLAHRSDPAAAAALGAAIRETPPGVFGLAWEVDPAIADLATAAQKVLDATGTLLSYVRLRGGGPEAAEQEGRSVGAFMARLALARYAGPLVLTPSTPQYLRAWGTWLGRHGGWGCGSKVADSSLVQLNL